MLEAAFQDGLSIPEVIAVRTATELREWLEEERRLPPHPLEERELVFDRLLLRTSVHYRRTRELAAAWGARLRPGNAEREGEVQYLPIRADLEKLLSGRRPLRGLAARLLDLRDSCRSTYHDLNHFIIGRAYRAEAKALRSRQGAVAYLALQETFATLRDVEIANELGRRNAPLKFLQLLYGEPGLFPVSPPGFREVFRHFLETPHAERPSRGKTRSGVPVELLPTILDVMATRIPRRESRSRVPLLSAKDLFSLPGNRRRVAALCRDYSTLFSAR
jgi:hypothetical protein